MKRYLKLSPCELCSNYIDTENDMFTQGSEGLLCCDCFDPVLLEIMEDDHVHH